MSGERTSTLSVWSRMLWLMCASASLFLLSSVCLCAPQTWRYGVGVATQNMVDGSTTTNLNLFEGYRTGDQPWNPLGLGWYFNWNWKQRYGSVCDSATGQCIEYMPLVGGWRPGVNPSIATIRSYVEANPTQYPDGTTWLIGNEIIWDDQRTPAQYAQDYHDFYYGLKSINPTFKVAIGSIITSVYYNRAGFQGTPIELANAIRTAYQTQYGETMPVDVWNIHPYVWTKPTVQEELIDLQNQLSQFRDWMQSVGEQDKPLIITEYGLLNYHTEQWMIDFMLGSFEILMSTGHPNGMPSDEGRWVQRWAWFVNNNHVWEAGGAIQWTHCALYNGDTFDMRPLGRAYANHPKEPNVSPSIVTCDISSPFLLADDETEYTITLTAADGNGVRDIRDMRVIFHTGGAWEPVNGRGYLVWGQSDYDIKAFGGTWNIAGDAEGGGRWGWSTDNWGGDTYITPVSASTSTTGSSRTVVFTFTVKPQWAPSGGQRIRTFAHDGGNTNTGWVESPDAYDVLATLDLGSVHNNPDDVIVTVPSAIVTAGSDQFANTIYVEAPNRSSGIRVYGSGIVAVEGNLVSVSGQMRTMYGERVIIYPNVTVAGTASNRIQPLVLTGRELGGDSPNAYTPGVYGGTGLYNVGLLVTIFGRVTFADSPARYFYIDDGSGRQDGSGQVGVKVTCSGLAVGNVIPVPAQGSYVMVTGVVAAQSSGGRIIPVLRPRTVADVVTIL